MSDFDYAQHIRIILDRYPVTADKYSEGSVYSLEHNLFAAHFFTLDSQRGTGHFARMTSYIVEKANATIVGGQTTNYVQFHLPDVIKIFVQLENEARSKNIPEDKIGWYIVLKYSSIDFTQGYEKVIFNEEDTIQMIREADNFVTGILSLKSGLPMDMVENMPDEWLSPMVNEIS